MSEPALKIEEPYVRVRPMTRPDLSDKAPFLCRRLREHYPALQDRQTYGWLQACCGNNEYFFVRSDRAYALAHMYRDFLDNRPSVREIFVLAETDDSKHPKNSDAEKYQGEQNAIALIEAAELYAAMIRWCQAIGADELIVDKLSDVPLGDKGKEDPGTLRAIFAKQKLTLYRGGELFVSLDPEARVRKIGA